MSVQLFLMHPWIHVWQWQKAFLHTSKQVLGTENRTVTRPGAGSRDPDATCNLLPKKRGASYTLVLPTRVRGANGNLRTSLPGYIYIYMKRLISLKQERLFCEIKPWQGLERCLPIWGCNRWFAVSQDLMSGVSLVVQWWCDAHALNYINATVES